MKANEKQVFDIATLDPKNLTDMTGWVEKQNEIVKANPFIEISDNKSYTKAKSNRTALVTARTSLTKQQQLIFDKLNGFKKIVQGEIENLIKITIESENKQQEEVKRYEAIKEAEKAKKAELERERIAAIHEKIDFYNKCFFGFINELKFKDVTSAFDTFDAMVTSKSEEFNFEEFNILFDEKVSERRKDLDFRIDFLKREESQRLENERLKKEREDAIEEKRIANEKFEKERKQALEAKRLADEKLEKERKENEVRRLKEKAIQDEKDQKAAKEKKELQDKLQAIEDEKEAKKLRLKKIEDDKKVEELAIKKRLEDEKRQEKFKDDKEKLDLFIHNIHQSSSMMLIDVKHEESIAFVKYIQEELGKWCAEKKEQLKEL